MKKKLFFLLTLLVCCVGQVWGASYSLVTDAASLNSGDVIVLGCAAKNTAAGAMGTNAYLGKVDVTFKDGVLTSDNAIEITLTKTANESNPGKYIYSLTTSEGTIGATAAKKMALDKGTTTWTISIDTDGTASISSTNSDYGRILYNVGSPRFLNYASATSATMLLPQIYKKSTTPPTDVLQSLTVSGTPTKTTYEAGEEFDPAGLTVTGTYSTSGSKTVTSGITWTFDPETLTAGTTSVSVTAKVGSVESAAYTVTGLTVTEKEVPSGELALTFDMSKNPGSWPTDNPTTLTNYTYTLDGENYTFALKNVKCNSGYLMLTATAVLGLPAIPGYKLTKVVAKNSGNCSTSVNVGVSASGTSAAYIEGGEAQKWATTSSSYTYNLTDTEANTVYYLYATSKNAQIVSLELTYVPTTTSADPSISADNVDIAAEATSGEIAYTITNPVEGQTLSASTEATWISNIQVTGEKVTFTTTANTEATERSADITLKYEGATDKDVTVTQAKPVPTYASLAELVAAGEPTTAGEPVNVTLTDEEITKFYVTGSYTNGVYLMVGTQEIEIYCKNVPSDWEVGGTISGTLENCTWKKFNTTWELCPDNWDALSYTAPAPAKTYTITWSVNGATSTEDVEEGEAINFKSAAVPAGYTDYVFRGWVASETISGNTEPTYLTEATATENITYYAVFAKKTTTGGSGDYEKVTTTPDTWAGEYLLVYESEENSSYGQTLSANKTDKAEIKKPTAIDIVDGTVAADETTEANAIFITENATSGYLLQTQSGYYFYNTTSTDNGFSVSNNESTAKKYEVTLAIDTDGNAVITAAGAILRYNTGSTIFQFYKPSSASGQKPVCLYKKQAGTVTYSDFCTILPAGLPVVIGSTGYATFYDRDNRIIPTGVKAYYCTKGEEGVLNTVQITNLSYIPRWTGVILEGTPGTYYLEEIPTIMADEEETDKIMDDNVLNGTLDDMSVEDLRAELGDYPVYVLAKKNDRLGFYKFTGDTLAGRKAFYVNANALVSGFILDFEGTEGINSVISATNLKAGYDIQGRKLNKMQKGINILNGKKIFK